MANKLLFYYFGDDEAYYRTLMGEFSRNTRLTIEFTRIFANNEKSVQSLFLKVFQDKPSCVFIDFSKHSQDYLHLARIIARTSFEHEFVTVGLVDYLSSADILLESIATGVDLTHIKSAETYDVVFDVAKLIAPNEIGEHGFATASLKESWEAALPVKIGYVNNEGIHFETDYPLNKGDRVKLKHHWLEKKIVPSREIFIKEVSKKNLFYHFKYAVDAEFLFIDEFLPPEGMEISDIEYRKKERAEYIIFHKKQLSKWLEENVERSQEKKAKVLIVDRDFKFYEDQQRTDKHPYTIRCVPFITNIEEEMDRLDPQVIAFAFDKPEVTNLQNTMEKLQNLLSFIKQKNNELQPFVVVFNSSEDSKALQNTFQYPHIISSDGEISVDVLLKMAGIFEKKLENSFSKVKAKHVDKVFLKKTIPASIAELSIPVEVIKLSETNMIFQTENPLPIGINLHFEKPVNMFVNVQPTKNQGKVPEYHGLIHCLGEDQKKELRRFVNAVFFREHDAQVSAETEEFKKLNEAKLLEKQEALKAQLEKEAQEKEQGQAEEKEEDKEPVPEVE